MYEFTSIKPEYDKEKISTDKIMLFDKLQIKNLCFRFPGRKQILNDINLNLTKGEVVAILGESGGGKSTLLNILQGFYKAESGSVLLNNQSLGDIYLPNLRDALGVVPQDIAVFNGTLLDNLTLGGTEAELKACIEFCQQTGFEKYFSLFPQSYATLLGEQGINISGGQKQLIGLCRALFKKPSLLLLDEPTSAMDIDMENFALKILNNYKNQCGILIVTHQLKIANVANRIYILKDSTIQAEGTKEDLLNTKNLYSQMMAEIVQTTSFIN
ncbi:MAG: ATP-binding cassette domain-containing protein, partial [Bacteroidales bacterium]|nr:ATP-binding cassette domain-containing protein [Bacteroidales bacterium]